MTRVVLYAADDMEPITVIDLPPYAESYLLHHRFVTLPVIQNIHPLREPLKPCDQPFMTVRISLEFVVRRGKRIPLLITYDEESALLLKCAFLPGQQAGLQKRERDAFARGFIQALTEIGFGK